MSLEKFIQNFRQEKGEDKKDCLGCRLVGGLGCIGLGCYITVQARSTTGVTYGGLMLFAAGFVFMGALRLSNVGLFNSNASIANINNSDHHKSDVLKRE